MADRRNLDPAIRHVTVLAPVSGSARPSGWVRDAVHAGGRPAAGPGRVRLTVKRVERATEACGAALAAASRSRAAWKTLTTAISTGSPPPSATPPCKESKRTRPRRNPATSRTTRPACATTGSAHAACSSAPASSGRAARPSSDSSSSGPACTGPSTVPTPHPHPALHRGQQPAGSHLQPPSQPDRSRLTCPHPKVILVTCKTGAHPTLESHDRIVGPPP